MLSDEERWEVFKDIVRSAESELRDTDASTIAEAAEVLDLPVVEDEDIDAIRDLLYDAVFFLP